MQEVVAAISVLLILLQPRLDDAALIGVRQRFESSGDLLDILGLLGKQGQSFLIDALSRSLNPSRDKVAGT